MERKRRKRRWRSQEPAGQLTRLVSPGAGPDPASHPLVEFSPQEAGGDAADGVAVAADLRLTDGQSGSFGRQSGLQVEVDCALEVPLALLHLPGLLVLARLRQPAVVVPPQGVQLRVALRLFTAGLEVRRKV